MTGALSRFWFPAAPAARLAVVRVLIGGFAAGYVFGRLPYLLSYAGFDPAQFRPVGVVSLLDRPLLPWVVVAVTVATAICSVPFFLGWRFRIFGPLFAALLLWTLTYRNSWGMIFHTENLLVLHVLVLGITRSADAWSLDARRRGSAPPGESVRYGWPLRLMAVLLVATYFLAGLAKLRFAGSAWTEGEVLRNVIASDNLRKVLLGSVHSPLAVPLLAHEWLFQAFALLTLVVELGAPIALFGRRLAAWWTAAVIAFHWGVLALMMILFPYPMFGFAFAPFFRVERPAEHLRTRWRCGWWGWKGGRGLRRSDRRRDRW